MGTPQILENLQCSLKMFRVGLLAGFIQVGNAGQVPFQLDDFVLGEWVRGLPQFPFES